MINISSYPRSGQVFFQHAASLLLEDGFKPVDHSTATIKSKIDNNEDIFIPFRNPLDSICSWNIYQKNGNRDGFNITSDIKYYIRYFSFVLNNINSVTLMDFDLFTTDINYLANKIGVIDTNSISLEDVKSYIASNDEKLTENNLPNNKNLEISESIKAEITSHELFPQCEELYKKLKEAHDNNNDRVAGQR